MFAFYAALPGLYIGVVSAKKTFWQGICQAIARLLRVSASDSWTKIGICIYGFQQTCFLYTKQIFSALGVSDGFWSSKVHTKLQEDATIGCA